MEDRFQQMPFWYLIHGDREGYKKITLKNNHLNKKKFFCFFNSKTVRIASYVRKPVKTMEIRKTHVKNVQIDTSAMYVLMPDVFYQKSYNSKSLIIRKIY